jgi:hypothetical protein
LDIASALAYDAGKDETRFRVSALTDFAPLYSTAPQSLLNFERPAK